MEYYITTYLTTDFFRSQKCPGRIRNRNNWPPGSVNQDYGSADPHPKEIPICIDPHIPQHCYVCSTVYMLCGWDLAWWIERLTVSAPVATALGFDPSIRWHSGIWWAADEAVLNKVRVYMLSMSETAFQLLIGKCLQKYSSQLFLLTPILQENRAQVLLNSWKNKFT